MELKNDYFILKSGRVFEPNRLIVGINPDMKVYEGYDAAVWGLHSYDSCDTSWTKEEKVELAEYMIGLWSQFKSEATHEKQEVDK